MNATMMNAPEAMADRLQIAVPSELKRLPGWLLWRAEPSRSRPGKLDKVPYYARSKTRRAGAQGSRADREQLARFDEVCLQLSEGKWSGVGLALLPEFGIVAGDFDAKDKPLHPEAEKLIAGTYAEHSPSGKGIRCFWRGTWPQDKSANHEAGIEVFAGNGFVTVTGNVIHPEGVAPLPEPVKARLMALVEPHRTAYDARARIAPGEVPTDEQVRDLRDALGHMPADGYDLWIAVGQCLKPSGEIGRALWLEWGAKSGKFDAQEAARKWDTLAGDRAGFRGVYSKAREHGWHNPKSKSDGPRSAPDDRAPLDWYAEAQQWANREGWTPDDGPRHVHFWQLEFYRWNGSKFDVDSLGDIRSRAYTYLGQQGRGKRANVDNLIDALRGLVKLSDRITPPAFIAESAYRASDVIPCRNGLLHIPTRELLPASAAFFTRNALSFDYAPDAPYPVEWLRFLTSIWDDDTEALDTLQEWFGLALTLDTRHQKALLMVGPKRSGKGTIARVLTELVGQANTCAPTLASLSQQFGLQPLIGKQLAIISDARLSGRTDPATVAENLLRITGEDHISVPRKYLEDYTARLPVRFMLMSNELPAIADASGALASRFIILAMTQSFYEREDKGLFDRIANELPGILQWALAGLDRLNDRGHFLQPASSRHLVEQLDELGSPIRAFLRERCTVAPGRWVQVAALFDAWRDWCRENNRDHEGTVQTFGRTLTAAASGVRLEQRRMEGTRLRVYEGISLNAIS